MSDAGAPTLDDVARHAAERATVDVRKVAPTLVIRSSTAPAETA